MTRFFENFPSPPLPFFGGMKDAEDVDHVRIDAVHDDVGQWGHDQLARALLLPEATSVRHPLQRTRGIIKLADRPFHE